MQKSLIMISMILAVILLTSTSALAAETISINDLIEGSIENDGRTVTVQGEAIGEVLERDSHAWVNLSDGGNAIGIWMTIEEAGQIKYFGDYKNSGDTIRITGVFSRNCPEHGGDIDIHTSSMIFVSSGEPVYEIIEPIKLVVSAIFAILAAGAIYFYFKKAKRA